MSKLSRNELLRLPKLFPNVGSQKKEDCLCILFKNFVFFFSPSSLLFWAFPFWQFCFHAFELDCQALGVRVSSGLHIGSVERLIYEIYHRNILLAHCFPLLCLESPCTAHFTVFFLLNHVSLLMRMTAVSEWSVSHHFSFNADFGGS